MEPFGIRFRFQSNRSSSLCLHSYRRHVGRHPGLLSTGDEGVSDIRSYPFLRCKNRPIGTWSSTTEKEQKLSGHVSMLPVFHTLFYKVTYFSYIVRSLETSNIPSERGIPLRDYQTLLIC